MSIFDRFWNSVKKTATPTATAVGDGQPTGDGARVVTEERRKRRRKNARSGARAVIIDDSATVVAVLRKTLRSAGYVTRDAADAESGLALISQEPPDLIFLDIVLPGMNGFGALRVIRKDARTQHIPVIMISGNEHATEQFYANRIGADLFMKKPFSRYDVFAHIESLLDEDQVPRRKGHGTSAPISDAAVASVASATQYEHDTIPAALAPMAPAFDATSVNWSLLDARKELTAMGLQYFSQAQFFAAVRRGDELAVALFVAGGGVALNEPMENETALSVAQKMGAVEIIRLLQAGASG